MKYWNKDKNVRQRCWTQIVVKPNSQGYAAMKRWCQQQSSSGKFYKYYGTETWWFERAEDATLFALRWAQ